MQLGNSFGGLMAQANGGAIGYNSFEVNSRSSGGINISQTTHAPFSNSMSTGFFNPFPPQALGVPMAPAFGGGGGFAFQPTSWSPPMVSDPSQGFDVSGLPGPLADMLGGPPVTSGSTQVFLPVDPGINSPFQGPSFFDQSFQGFAPEGFMQNPFEFGPSQNTWEGIPENPSPMMFAQHQTLDAGYGGDSLQASPDPWWQGLTQMVSPFFRGFIPSSDSPQAATSFDALRHIRQQTPSMPLMAPEQSAQRQPFGFFAHDQF